MKTLKLALLGAAGALALGGAAQAQEAESKPFDLTFNIGAATEYVFRGVSQTDEDPQIFGGVDATLGSIGYAGVWLSNVDFLDSTTMEYDIYGGIKPVAGPVTLDLGFIYYGYANQPSGADYDNWEIKLAGSVPAGPATVTAAVFYSPDGFGAADESAYYELSGSTSISEKLSLSAAVGRQTYDGPGDYTTWNIGLGYALTSNVGVDVRYYDTSEHDFGKLYESRLVASIKATF
jgi:uncharacterized protein (TIGR02001 family)